MSDPLVYTFLSRRRECQRRRECLESLARSIFHASRLGLVDTTVWPARQKLIPTNSARPDSTIHRFVDKRCTLSFFYILPVAAFRSFLLKLSYRALHSLVHVCKRISILTFNRIRSFVFTINQSTSPTLTLVDTFTLIQHAQLWL